MLLWKGMAIGGVLGFMLGRGVWGAVFGAMIGYQVHRRIMLGRLRSSGARRDSARRRAPDPLLAAYSVLGARPSDSAAELTRRYRELAKRHHPDAMRAKGASEAEIAKATDRMSRINAAWAEVRSARGI